MVKSLRPIAITGLACRYPGGANNPESFWKLMLDRKDAITEIPPDRWNIDKFYHPDQAHMARTHSKWGGFIDGIDKFDPQFFGMTEREAHYIDPQHRLLLEASWEAIDNGGHVLDVMRQHNPGVFVGISTFDYAILQGVPEGNYNGSPYTATGTATSIAANRISYSLDFKGPSLSVDTACSSSLMALHLAFQSLQRGDCGMALVGGVNCLVLPLNFIAFSNLAALSPDGRCKTFDASANGFVRSEGVGVVVLRPLEDAIADGDRIYGVLLNTGANQDGKTPGLAYPNVNSQMSIISNTCRRAGVDPRSIRYVEAHGTGTVAGDAVEASALGQSAGEGRAPGNELIVGSVKTNIGHLEAGAGLASLIKCALIMKNGLIPPNIHFINPSPSIAFDKLHLRVPTDPEPFAVEGKRTGQLIGINSFGFGGANAFALLEPYNAVKSGVKKKKAKSFAQANRPCLLPLSARSKEALAGQAARMADYLSVSGEDHGLSTLCRYAFTRRTHHQHRLLAIGGSGAAIADHLRIFSAGEHVSSIISGQVAVNDVQKPVFVFSGQGPQWQGMGRELYEKEPVYRDMIDKCHELLCRRGDYDLLGELSRDEASSRLADTSVAQPAIFALQVALCALLESWGVRPAAVVGHSVGEVAAAYVAGVLSLDNAIRVIYPRGRYMASASNEGRMLALGMSEQEALDILTPYVDQVSIAAVNGPESVTLSGDKLALEKIARYAKEKKRFHRFLPVIYAFHSLHMDPIRADLLRSFKGIRPSAPKLPMISTVTGKPVLGATLDAEYWWQNVRSSVRFFPAVQNLIQAGHSLFVEIAPQAVLGSSLRQCAATKDGDKSLTVLPTLRRKGDDQQSLAELMGQLYCNGVELDGDKLYPCSECKSVSLPAYAWQNQSYWHELEPWRKSRMGQAIHPLLSRKHDHAGPIWVSDLDLRILSYLKDHRLQGHAVFPGAGYVEMMLGAASQVFPVGPCQVSNIEFTSMLSLPDGDGHPSVEVRYSSVSQNVTIHSSASGTSDSWQLHARSRIEQLSGVKQSAQMDLDNIRAACTRPLPVDRLYSRLAEIGLEYGPCFRGLKSVLFRTGEVFGEVDVSSMNISDIGKYLMHPSILDSCIQVAAAALPVNEDRCDVDMYVPVSIKSVRWFAHLPAKVWAHAVLKGHSPGVMLLDVTIAGPDGLILAELTDLCLQSLPGKAGRGSNIESMFYQTDWIYKPLPVAMQSCQPSAPSGFLSATSGMVAELQKELSAENLPRSLLSCYRAAEADINKQATAYVVKAFITRGWAPQTFSRISIADLATLMDVPPECELLFGLCIEWLQRDGFVVAGGEGPEKTLEVLRPFAADLDVEELWRSLVFRFPALFADVTLLKTFGGALAEALSGKIDLQDLAESTAVKDLLDHSESASVFSRGMESTVVAAMQRVQNSLPVGRMLRVLDTGSCRSITMAVLSVLDPKLAHYTLLSPAEADKVVAEGHFSAFSAVEFRVADAASDEPADQEMKADYDVVIIPRLYQPNAEKIFRNAAKWLAPGAMLIACAFDIRPRIRELLSFVWPEMKGASCLRQKWTELLCAAGLMDVSSVSETNGVSESGSAVYFARKNHDLAVNVLPSLPAVSGRWLIFADRTWIRDRLAAIIRERGGDAEVADAGRPIKDTLSAGAIKGIVLLLGLDVAELSGAGVDAVRHELKRNCDCVLSLVKALMERQVELPRLDLVTTMAQSIGSAPEHISPVSSALSGFGRVIAMEVPALKCRRIDLPRDMEDVIFRGLMDELLSADDGEDEIALRGEGRFVQRVVPGSMTRPSVAADANAWRLEIEVPGSLDRLVYRPERRAELDAGTIEIEIDATGLNFRDVMKALGMYPREAVDINKLGDECVGRISRIGAGVSGFAVGERVVAFASGCFASHAVTYSACAMHLPEWISNEEGATLLVSYATAYHSLYTLAHMTKGERVLIHAGAGGVGLAAIQLALDAGVEIFATAGSQLKREFLSSLGVHHVMNSRTLSFADDVMRITNGEGVDIVLNSLAGLAIPKSLELLRIHGRFLEIGKRDIYGGSEISLRPFRNCISMHAVDMARMMSGAGIGPVLSELGRMLTQRRIHPLPYRAFSMKDAIVAFRHMAQARHIGKIVLSRCAQMPTVVAGVSKEPFRVEGDATYMVTGGLRGVGLVLAEWLVRKGARHLVLTSRSGPGPDSVEVIARLKSAGVSVRAESSDISDPTALALLLKNISEHMPPLRGVIHGAMVLQDKTIGQMEASDFEAVLASKAYGAWNLHLQTLGMPLDFFVLMSSISALVGNPGQANYVSANAFVDALAVYRRSLGLPGLSVQWDMISEVGVAARNKELQDHFRKLGLQGLTPGQVQRALDRLLSNDSTQMCVTAMQWAKFGKQMGLAQRTHRFDLLIGTDKDAGGDSAGMFKEEFDSAPQEQKAPLLQEFLRRQIAEITRMPVRKVDVNANLYQMGLDSLMGVELVMRLESNLGITVSSNQLAGNPTIACLTAELISRLMPQSGTDVPVKDLPSREKPTQQCEPENDQLLADSLELSDVKCAERAFADPENILLTGGTGFLGAYMLRELFANTSAIIHCLVRAEDEKSAMRRLLDNCSKYGISVSPKNISRLRIVLGDVSREQLGIGADERRVLRERIDSVFHSAAVLNHLASYQDLRAVNVLGTYEVLKLAGEGRRKPVHLISSIAALGTSEGGQHREFTEEAGPLDDLGKTNAYGQGKRVSEALAWRMREKGLPVVVYRPGLLIGDSKSGVSTPDDIIWRLLKTCAVLGVAPESRSDMFLTPVDYAARAIVWLSKRPVSDGRNFHIINSHPFSFDDLIHAAKAFGFQMRTVSDAEWIGALTGKDQTLENNAVLPFIKNYPMHELMAMLDLRTSFGSDLTMKALKASRITCPALNQKHLFACFKHFVEIKFL